MGALLTEEIIQGVSMQTTTCHAVMPEVAQESKDASSYLCFLLCIFSWMAVVLVLSPPEESSGHFQL